MNKQKRQQEIEDIFNDYTKEQIRDALKILAVEDKSLPEKIRKEIEAL